MNEVRVFGASKPAYKPNFTVVPNNTSSKIGTFVRESNDNLSERINFSN